MTRLMWKQRSTKQIFFNLGISVFGLALITIGFRMLSGEWAGFAGGFLLMTGIQIFCWVIGVRLEIIGNLTDDAPHSSSGSETTQGTSAIPQH